MKSKAAHNQVGRLRLVKNNTSQNHKENHMNKSFIKEVDNKMFILTYCQLIMHFAEQVILYLSLRSF